MRRNLLPLRISNVFEKEKDHIEERMEKTEAVSDQRIGYFQGRGYDAAATCLRRAEIGMFGYIRRRPKWGEFHPELRRWLKELCGNLAGESRKLLVDGVTRA